MKRRGHRPMVITSRHMNSLSKEDKSGDIPIKRVSPSAYLGKGPLMPTYGWHVWALTGSADIVHLWLPQFDAGVSAIVARLRGRPVLLTYNCMMTGDTMVSKVSASICELSHIIAGTFASKIVATTEDYARHSRFCRLFRHKLEFIDVPVPNWPDTIIPYAEPKSPFRIGFVGRVSPEKSIDVLLNAGDTLSNKLGSDFTLEFVGPIESGMKASIEATWAHHCIFHGQVSDDELDQFYKDIDVLVLPSNNRIEAFGLVQVEAMLRGTPCIASDLPGMRRPILRTNFGYLFEAGDSDALGHVICKVLLDGPPKVPTADELEEAFSVERIYNRYEELYVGLSGESLGAEFRSNKRKEKSSKGD